MRFFRAAARIEPPGSFGGERGRLRMTKVWGKGQKGHRRAVEVNMYNGTVIDDLIQAVQKAETEAQQSATAGPKAIQPGTVDLQLFMHEMQFAQRTHLGVA
jgi:hypothetical protein